MILTKAPFTSLLVVASLFSFSIVSAQAAQIYVEHATGSGVGVSDLETATELVQSAVPDVSSNTVIDDQGKADFILVPRLVRLGESYILTLSKVKNGETVFTSQLKALRLEELDKVSQRLTRSVLLGESAKSNPRVGEITNEEATQGTQRRPVRYEKYIGMGGSNFTNLNSTGIGYSLGLAWGWDFNNFMLKFLGEGDVNGSAFFSTLGVGGDYFFSTTDIAPYISGDFGGGVAKVDAGSVFDGKTIGGFSAGTGAGVRLLRTYAVNVDLGFHAEWLLRSNNYGHPQALSLRLGIYF